MRDRNGSKRSAVFKRVSSDAHGALRDRDPRDPLAAQEGFLSDLPYGNTPQLRRNFDNRCAARIAGNARRSVLEQLICKRLRRTAGKQGNRKIKYDALSKIIESKKYFLLYDHNSGGYMLSKDVVSSEDAKTLRIKFIEVMPEGKYITIRDW